MKLKLYQQAPLFSQLFMIVVLMFFVLNIFSKGALSSVFSLRPYEVIDTIQWWRIFTFPLATSSIESISLLLISMGLFAPALEVSLSTRWFSLSVLGLFALQGLLFTLTFGYIDDRAMLTGADSLSFFIMASYTFIIPHRSIQLWKDKEVHGLSLVIAITALAFFVSSFYAVRSTEHYFNGALSSAFGVLGAIVLTAIVHRRLRAIRKQTAFADQDYYEYKHRPQQENESELVETGAPSTSSTPRIPVQQQFTHTLPVESDEERMNRLLDKIFDEGQESLTSEERLFLDEYSRRIR
jgi:hypothetical protein